MHATESTYSEFMIQLRESFLLSTSGPRMQIVFIYDDDCKIMRSLRILSRRIPEWRKVST